MSTESVSGKVDQVKGEVKQSVGEAIGNDRLANSGTVDQIKGHAKEAWGVTKENAGSLADDAKARSDNARVESKTHNEETAHNVRNSVAGAAEDVKNFVTGKK